MRSKLVIGALVAVLLMGISAACLAAEAAAPTGEEAVKPARGDLGTGIIALAAALAVGVCAVATGIAQSRIGAAGCGTIAERPEAAGTVLVMLAIPETMVILGFVVAVVILFTL